MNAQKTAANLMSKAERACASAHVLMQLGDADGACNRAYYAMFDAARAALLISAIRAPGAPADLGKTHRGTLSAFSEHLVKSGRVAKELGRLLKNAETFRYVADYEGDSVELSDAEEMVHQANTFISALRSEFML